MEFITLIQSLHTLPTVGHTYVLDVPTRQYLQCQWGVWNDWTRCDSECVGGTRTRTRYINITMDQGGKECNEDECEDQDSNNNCGLQTEECNSKKECSGLILLSYLQCGIP